MFKIMGNEILAKADLTKLKLKRGVMDETGDLEKFLDRLQKLANDKTSDLGQYGPALDAFSRAFKDFKSKNSKKHPKFISDVQSAGQDSIDEIVKEMSTLLKKSKDVRGGLVECEGFAKDLVNELKKPLDLNSLKKSLKALAGFGSVLGGVYDNSRVIFRDTSAAPYDEVMTKIAEIRKLKEPVDKILTIADNKGNTSFDTAPLLDRCNKMHMLITSSIRGLG